MLPVLLHTWIASYTASRLAQGAPTGRAGYNYAASNSLFGLQDLNASKVTYAGIDAPSALIAGNENSGVDVSKFAVFPAATVGAYFVYDIPDEIGCPPGSLAASIGDLMDIYRGNMTIWQELYTRHPVENACLENVTEKFKPLFLTPVGLNYLIQFIFHQYAINTGDLSRWPDPPALKWSQNSTWADMPKIPSMVDDTLAFNYTNFTIAYAPSPQSVTIPTYNIFKHLPDFAGAPPMQLSDATLGRAVQSFNCLSASSVLNCTTCWPYVGCSYFMLRTASDAPPSDPQTPDSCLNVQAAINFFAWALLSPFPTFLPNKYAQISPFYPLTDRNRDRSVMILQNITCNGQIVWNSDWSFKLRNLLLSIFIPVAVFLICVILGAYFFILRRERAHEQQLSNLASLGEQDYSAHLLGDDNPDDHVYGQKSGSGGASAARGKTGPRSGPDGAHGSKSDADLAKVMTSVDSLMIGSLLGTGSYGEVYNGMYKHNLVAIKRLASSSDPEKTQSFLAEVRAMSELDHPNILRLIAIAYEPPYTYIVTEHCKYGSVEDYMKHNGADITINEKLALMLGAAKGMRYLHAKDIAHRDLKLSNLLVSEGKIVKVGDLGTAIDASGTLRERAGTLDYCAPEVIDGQAYTKSCDVYSFGVCLWVLFSGQPLFPNWTMYDVVTKVVGGVRPPLDCIPSARLAKLIEKCWSSYTQERPTFDGIVLALSDMSEADFTSRS